MAKFEVVSVFEGMNVILPKRATKGSAGYDFYAIEDVILPPHMVAPTILNTGVKAQLDEGQVLQLHIRSSLGIKHGLELANTTGIIDADYYNNPDNEGHIMIALLNRSNKGFKINKGDRVAQGIITHYFITEDDNTEEERQGGIGSTTK